ncbi:MAG: ACT domain-containing protein [Lachnospiraceae bacterium]|nr:ACT domain-containing protein [Lachnospiraceae bacterium]
MDRTIITVVGKDTVGIIARVCTYLSEHHINVLDISQTIVQEFFNMMMIADLKNSDKPFDQCARDLEALGEEIGVNIKCQREEIFQKMHRI